jgi:hypothetical protein
MSTGAIIGIIIAVIVVAAIVVVASALLRRARMRRQFGPEYDRLAKEIGPRKADAELTARQRRVEALDIHPLSAELQARYSTDWAMIQERFVDAPAESVSAADTLVWNVMRDRGYPADDRNASIEALSVYHAGSLEGYRRTQDLRAESATTEQLRDALIRYRALFEDLTGLREGPGESGRARVAEIRGGGSQNVGNQNVAGNSGSLAGTGDRIGTNGDRMGGNGDLAAEHGDLAAEDIDRTADRP